MKKNTKTQTTSKLRIGLILSLFLILQQAEATSYDIQDVPEKSSGSLFSAEEFNNMMGVSRSWVRDDNNTFGNAVTHVGENFTDDTLTTQAKIHAKELQIDGQVIASSFTGDGSSLTGIDTGKWDNATGGINYSGGKVGVGTTTPEQTLDVNGSIEVSNQIWFEDDSGATKWKVGQSGLANGADFIIYDADAGARILINETNGNVGIGTNSPGAKLEVAGDIKVGVDGTTKGKITFFNNTTESNDPYIAASSKSGGVGNDLEIKTTSTNGSIYLDATGHINFQTNGADKMVLLENGNVGIGTTSPGTKLEVYTTTSTDGITLAGTNAPALTIKNSKDAKAYLGLATTDGNWDGASKAGDIVLRTEGGALRVNTNSGNLASAFTVLGSNGNIGIGTTVPTVKLDIQSGGIGTSATKLKLGRWVQSSNDSDMISDSTSSYSLAFKGGGLLGGDVTALSIYRNGNVGIGKTPTTKFDVNGTVKATAFVGDGSGLTGLSSGGKFVDGASSVNAVYTAGNVGIGTTSPGEKLEVAGNILVTNNNYPDNNGLYSSGNIILTAGQPHILLKDKINAEKAWDLNQYNGDLNFDSPSMGILNRKVTIKSNGNVGIGTTTPSEKLEVVGNIKATDFLYSSDKRLKKDIKTLKGLDLVKNLRGVSFKWKESNQKSVGFIAQEVEKVLPELVATAENTGLKSVKYGNITAVLVEAVKSQQKEIEVLKQEVRNLKK